MDDEEFDDLLAGVDFLEGSSQESLTSAAANLHFCDDSNDDDERMHTVPASPPSSTELHDSADAKAQRITAQTIDLPNQVFPVEVVTTNGNGQHPSGHDHSSKYATHCCIDYDPGMAC